MPSDNETSGSSFLQNTLLPVVAAVSLCAGALIRFYAYEEAFRDAMGSFCDAIFIASFLAYFVDPALKRGLLKEGIKDIFRYAYGYSLAPELQEFFEDNIAGAKVMRKSCRLHWRIDPISGEPRAVQVRLHASFDVANLTGDAHSYTHKVLALSDTPGDNGSVEGLYCKSITTGEFRYNLTKPLLIDVPGDETASWEGYKCGEAVPLGKRSPNGHAPFTFGVHYYSESTFPDGVDQFMFSEVTSGVEVIITVSEQLRSQIFSIIPSPPSGLDQATPKPDPQTRELRCCWSFPRLFVPNETIVIRWQEGVLAAGDPAAH